MEINRISPWKWQDARSYSQAVEVKNAQGTLYVSGQTAIDENGNSSAEDMKTQLIKTLSNLERVINEAGYSCSNIVKLNVYTTSTEELWPHFSIFQDWLKKHETNQALTVLEVVSLFETLKVEIEATVVK